MFSKILLLALLVTVGHCTVSEEQNPPFGLPNCTVAPCYRGWFPNTTSVYLNLPVTHQVWLAYYINLITYETLAAYSPVRVGPVLKGEIRAPVYQRTTKNKETAYMQVFWRYFTWLAPGQTSTWLALMNRYGLTPSNSRDTSNPQGLANVVYDRVSNFLNHDGFNNLGDIPNIKYNRLNFSDYTGFEPKNPPEFVPKDPTRHLEWPDLWQQLRVQDNFEQNRNRFEIRIQTFITPQLQELKTVLLSNREKKEGYSNFPTIKDTFAGNGKIVKSNNRSLASRAYRKKVDSIISASKLLNDLQKVQAEFFDAKIPSLGVMTRYLVDTRSPNNSDEFVKLSFLLDAAVIDGWAVLWRVKRNNNGIRPRTAVRFLYDNDTITAYRGPFQGVGQLKAYQWNSYLPTSPHPEYPSATACSCAIFGTVVEKYYNSAAFGFTLNATKGSSAYEPGLTPANNVSITYPTIPNLIENCANSRFWAGVHFPFSNEQSVLHCPYLGIKTFKNFKELESGRVPFDVNEEDSTTETA